MPVLKDRLRSLSLKVGGKKGELVIGCYESARTRAPRAKRNRCCATATRHRRGRRLDWGFDDDDAPEDEEDAGTDMADRLARASAGDAATEGPARRTTSAAAPRILRLRSAPGTATAAARRSMSGRGADVPATRYNIAAEREI